MPLLIPEYWLVAAIGLRCVLLAWRIVKRRDFRGLVLLFPRLFMLALFSWIWMGRPMFAVDVPRILTRWAVLALFATEILVDAVEWGVKYER